VSNVYVGAPARRAIPRRVLAALLAGACLPVGGWAAELSYAEALELARQAAPSLRAADAALAGATAAQPAAAALPDPRLAVGVDNLPISGADKWSLSTDPMTMQRLALMQEVPNRGKREARLQVAQARIERERAALATAALAVKREAALAWLAVYHAERRRALWAGLKRENRVLQDTLPARIAAGTAQPAELTMARQDALAIEDREEELQRELRRARAELRRWVGARADDRLAGAPQLPELQIDELRSSLQRHADVAAYSPLRDLAAAEMAEADADKGGDWSWEVAYSRRPNYDDMVSFQIKFDLPWQQARRQQPAVEAKRQEAARIEAEREDLLRRRAAEVESQLAEAAALQAQLVRAQGPGLALADERVALATASYQSGRGDLAAVLGARTQQVELRLRVVELESRRDALRLRLGTWIAE
jgi:outer membrane protein TolC